MKSYCWTLGGDKQSFNGAIGLTESTASHRIGYDVVQNSLPVEGTSTRLEVNFLSMGRAPAALLRTQQRVDDKRPNKRNNEMMPFLGSPWNGTVSYDTRTTVGHLATFVRRKKNIFSEQNQTLFHPGAHWGNAQPQIQRDGVIHCDP